MKARVLIDNPLPCKHLYSDVWILEVTPRSLELYPEEFCLEFTYDELNEECACIGEKTNKHTKMTKGDFWRIVYDNDIKFNFEPDDVFLWDAFLRFVNTEIEGLNIRLYEKL